MKEFIPIRADDVIMQLINKFYKEGPNDAVLKELMMMRVELLDENRYE